MQCARTHALWHTSPGQQKKKLHTHVVRRGAIHVVHSLSFSGSEISCIRFFFLFVSTSNVQIFNSELIRSCSLYEFTHIHYIFIYIELCAHYPLTHLCLPSSIYIYTFGYYLFIRQKQQRSDKDKEKKKA